MRLLPPCLCIYVVVLSRSHDVAEFCVLFCQAGMLPMCFRRIMGRHFKDLLLHSNMESSVSLNHCSQRPTLCAPQQDVHISGYYPEGTTPNNSWGKMLQVLQHFLSMLHQAAKITSPTGRHGLTTQSHALLQQRQHIHHKTPLPTACAADCAKSGLERKRWKTLHHNRQFTPLCITIHCALLQHLN